MPSLIPGYEYDIFISYRQKDNKYDGWVTEFVENLKRELDSMFKEEISVYFDINPHDGLLETHEVDASLREKLKCLVCIPIISRTYCDPKSFAWEHEFKAFIELASTDQFGLKIKLPNGNIANRVLPVRIHDLDSSDISLFESTIGGVLRPVDFIYKETGVNRQLRAKDDDIIKSPGHVLYRDQINKVALAVREIIQSMRLQLARDRKKEKEIPGEEKIKQQEYLSEEQLRLEKDESKDKIKPDQAKPEKTGKTSPAFFKPKMLIPLFILLFILAGAILLLNHRAKVRWAKDEGLQEIERLYDEENYVEAFNLAGKAERYISKDSLLMERLSKVGTKLTILTDPPEADVFWKAYSDTSDSWPHIGQTPIDGIKMPVQTFYRFRIEKTGYETVFGATRTSVDTLSRKLFKTGEIPPGMVYVDGYWDEVKNTWEEEYGSFIDKYEVTNKQYKEFVDKGGYRNHAYWTNEFIKDGKKLSFDEALSKFIDKTGRPGPSTWEAGDYPEGQDDYPVRGVSWYEAAAFAEYSGKILPTADHWDSGVGFYWPSIWTNFGPEIYPLSNIDSKDLVPVGRKKAISCFGAYDMAGNVREWCSNESSNGRIIAGGGWDDASYVFETWNQLPSFDRSPQNGFRCALYIDKERIPGTAFRFIELSTRDERDYSRENPVPEQTFQIYKNQFLYDRTELNAKIEERDNTPNDYIIEKVTFDAAYGKDRMIAYLALPRNASPPYQALIFFPGSMAIRYKDLKTNRYGPEALEFVLKSGRAAVFPIYFGTFERNDNQVRKSDAEHSHQYTENLIKWVKDFSRSIDYLETRPDIDIDKLGFYGFSWGGRLGAIIPAVEKRLAVNILVLGGFNPFSPYPEADEINYVSRISIPTLMLNGKYDSSFDLDNQVIPFFRLIGTPEADKRLCIYESGHYISQKYKVKEVLEWLDKYFGPVNYLHEE